MDWVHNRKELLLQKLSDVRDKLVYPFRKQQSDRALAEQMMAFRAQRGQVILDYFLFDVDHILKGVDHLVFVCALILLLSLCK